MAEHLRSGALEPVLPQFPPEPVTLAVLYPHRTLVASKVRAFSDFVIERMRRVVATALERLEV